MSLNWREIDCILDELHLQSAHIQKIRQPDFQTLVFSIYHREYGRSQLLISLEPGANRLNRTTMPVEKKQAKLQRFAQFLRARVPGGRITDCRQLGRDRIILISIRQGGQYTHLLIRLWGGAGNVIAVDDDFTILDALFRRPGKGEVSGAKMTLPPLAAASFLEGGTIAELLRDTPEDVQVLDEHGNRALSAAARRELHKTGNTGTDSNKPGNETGNRDFHIRERDTTRSFNEQIEQEYSGLHTRQELDRLVAAADNLLNEKTDKLRGSLAKLEKRLASSEQFEQYKKTGDLLAANAHALRKGKEWIDVTDFETGNTVRIALQPEKSTGENIDFYYRKYHKARGALANLQEEIENVRGQLAGIQAEREHLLQAGNMDDDERTSLLRQFVNQEKQAPRQSGSQDRILPPGLQFKSGGFMILVGRTAAENDMLLRKYTRGNDFWLHTRDYPGGYVFIKAIKGKSIPLETLLDAGNLALYYSKGRSSGKGELYYTQVKYLRRAKHGQLGLVIPTQEKNLSVSLDQKRLDALFTHGSGQ